MGQVITLTNHFTIFLVGIAAIAGGTTAAVIILVIVITIIILIVCYLCKRNVSILMLVKKIKCAKKQNIKHK